LHHARCSRRQAFLLARARRDVGSCPQYNTVTRFTSEGSRRVYAGTAPQSGCLEMQQETTMKTVVQLVLAATVLFGAASSAFAGANDQYENGNDRYPWLSNQSTNTRP
jgi:hypothetical protein